MSYLISFWAKGLDCCQRPFKSSHVFCLKVHSVTSLKTSLNLWKAFQLYRLANATRWLLPCLSYFCTYIPPQQVHCNNMFSRGVRMFRQASCYFRSGSEWESDPVTFRPVVDRVSQSARFITVPLGDRTASSIKCRFHFSDLWLLFSEVAFQSGKVESLPDVSHWAGFLYFHVSWT